MLEQLEDHEKKQHHTVKNTKNAFRLKVVIEQHKICYAWTFGIVNEQCFLMMWTETGRHGSL